MLTYLTLYWYITFAFFSIDRVACIEYDYLPHINDDKDRVQLVMLGTVEAKNIQVTTNFAAAFADETCFGVPTEALLLTNTPGDSSKTLFKQYSVNLSMANQSRIVISADGDHSCNITMLNASECQVFTGAAVPIVQALSIEGVPVALYNPCTNSTQECVSQEDGFLVAGYVAGWAFPLRQDIHSIQYKAFNELIYAFMSFDPATGDIIPLGNPQTDGWSLRVLARAARVYRHIRISLSVGGWTRGPLTVSPFLYTLALNPQATQVFAGSLVRIIRELGFHGIDMDWEWWSDADRSRPPARQMHNFFMAIRKAMDAAQIQDQTKYFLSFATSGCRSEIVGMRLPNNPHYLEEYWLKIARLVDRFYIMTYGYHGPSTTSGYSYFQGNKNFQNVGDLQVGQRNGLAIDIAVQNYLKMGIPKDKLVLGLPAQVRSTKVSSSDQGGLLQPAQGAGIGDRERGIMDLKCLSNPVLDSMKGCSSTKVPLQQLRNLVYYNETSNTEIFNKYGRPTMQTWAFSPESMSFITYETKWSVNQKCGLIKSSQMAGVFFWAIDGDHVDSNQSLVWPVSNCLNRQQA